jgi:hypothetical protein
MAINIPIISDFDAKGVNRAIKEFKQLETAGEKAQFAIKKAAIPAAAALAGLAAAAGPAISAASDLEENLSKVNVIFGEGAKDIEEFAKTAATALGQSQNAVLTAAGTFGTFGKAAGLGGAELAAFSNDFTALASDLASFNNTSPEAAVNAIGAALRGEAEPLRAFGVLLNDATLKAAALELGIYSGSGALTDQQKILAAQKVIYDQTGDAQGDFAKTSDGLANSQRILSAEIKNLQVEIGKGLLPVVDAVLPFLTKFAAWASDNPKAFQIIAATIAGIATAILAVNFAMRANPFTLIAIGVAALVTALVIAYTKFETFRNIVNTLLNGLIGGFEAFANGFIDSINTIIRGLNLISPFSDIKYLENIRLGRVGGEGAKSTGGAAREGGTGAFGSGPSLTDLPALPPLPTGVGGVGTGGGGGGGGVAAVPMAPFMQDLSKQFMAGTQTRESVLDRFSGEARNAMLERGGITVNVNGGLATSADIGRAVVNSIKAMNRVDGPAQIQVA